MKQFGVKVYDTSLYYLFLVLYSTLIYNKTNTENRAVIL